MQVDESYEVEPAGPGTFVSPNRETTFFQFCRKYEQRICVAIIQAENLVLESLEANPRGSDVSQVLQE